MNRDKLGYEEFSEYVYENISKIIINRNYISENQDFFNLLLFKTWEDYHCSYLEEISLTKYLKMVEIFLAVMLKEKPSFELPVDLV